MAGAKAKLIGTATVLGRDAVRGGVRQHDKGGQAGKRLQQAGNTHRSEPARELGGVDGDAPARVPRRRRAASLQAPTLGTRGPAVVQQDVLWRVGNVQGHIWRAGNKGISNVHAGGRGRQAARKFVAWAADNSPFPSSIRKPARPPDRLVAEKAHRVTGGLQRTLRDVARRPEQQLFRHVIAERVPGAPARERQAGRRAW